MALFNSTVQLIRSGIRRIGGRLSRNRLARAPHKQRARRLRAETLESRRLLAADFQPFHHNHFDAEDVNDDGLVSPIDALMVINSINQKLQRDDLNFIDVNNDGLLSPQDALSVINRLNRAEQGSRRHHPLQDESLPSLPDEVRSIDGTNNNLQNPDLGSAGEELLRIANVDGSQVYGSDIETAHGLRAFEGGKLLITDAGLLPTDTDGSIMAGDIRADDNISLTALQALFVREHNRLADEITAADATLTDEQIYQQARAIVIAEIQAITYNEFLPALLGNQAISRYQGYDSSVDPTIANEFSTAAYRFGHSTINDEVEFFDNDGRAVSDAITLAEAFLNPQLLEETGIDTLLKYEASTQAQEVDLEVVDSLRNALFGPPGSGGLDLAALNIQRGRDHGLSDYNSTRQAYGLRAVNSFAEITSDVELQGKLESLYGDVNNIDLWVGLLAEDHVRGASVGELTQTIIVDQFERLRDGDRFWYETTFSGSELRQLQQTSLSDVIERNTTVTGLQDNVFFMVAEVSGQVSIAAETTTSRRQSEPRSSTIGVEGITLELLDDAGEVIDSTTTDRRGNYRFSSFAETGDYQIRIVGSDLYQPISVDLLDVLVSNGKTRLRGLDFMVS